MLPDATRTRLKRATQMRDERGNDGADHIHEFAYFEDMAVRTETDAKPVLPKRKTVTTEAGRDFYAEAQEWVSDNWTKPDKARWLHFWQDNFYEYDGACYRPIAAEDMRALAYPRLAKVGPVRKSHVDNLVDATKAAAKLPDSTEAPSFIGGNENPGDFIPCANGLLHVPTRTLRPATSDFFTLNALDFAFNAGAPIPQAWHDFLYSIWNGDPKAIETLQEWFGYCLTHDTSHQKILLVVGPKRSGKGTIARLLNRLIGAANCCAPTLENIGSHFGLQELIGKQLGIVSDARLGHKTNTASVAENLLRISGEDHISVPRKFLPDFTARLPVRFMLMTNELPALADASGALASRFIILAMTQSFFGREDRALPDRLTGELPGILNWALDGLARLNDRGYFNQPTSAVHLVEQLDELGSPIKAFIQDRCTVAPGQWVAIPALFDAWRDWCRENNREHEGTLQTFGRMLSAAAPGVRVVQPRIDGGRERRYEGIGLGSRP